MSDLMLQTIIFSFVLFIALAGLTLFFKSNNSSKHTQELSSLESDNQELTDKNLSLAQEITEAKQSLAVSQATIHHLKGVKEEYADNQKALLKQQENLSQLKVEFSKLQAQHEEKVGQLELMSVDAVTTKSELESVRQLNLKLSQENAELTEKVSQIEELKLEISAQKSEINSKNQKITTLMSEQSADVESKKALQDKIELLERTEKRMLTEFENTANKIFKEKTGEFSQQNKTSLVSLLSPLKEQIGTFSRQVTDTYTSEAKDRHALKEEVGTLKQLNERMSKEAIALTQAIKGDNKAQGTWGEVVLERVLQESGLRNNHEYETQVNLKDEQGSSFKPDVVVHLPGGKDVIIDSKMALTAYERYFNSEDEVTRKSALSDHIKSIKAHINGLGTKNYQDLHGVKTLDYVLMFIPVEAAFNTAIEHDPELVQLALDKNIMLVSPTNLMVALKTINNMWRVEHQNVNAQEIAKKAGAIYDKLVGFVDDMNKLGTHMKRAEDSYDGAMRKLSTGRGNLIRQAENMKELQISNNKSLPASIVEQSESEVEAIDNVREIS